MTETGAGGIRAWQAVLAVGALAIALRVVAFAPFDISHADELMQYLEQANRLATGHGIRPWETRAGLRNEIIPQVLSIPFWIGHQVAPGTEAGFIAARALFAALTLIALPGAWRLGALTSGRHALAALFAAGVWWESVLFSDLVLSESLAAAMMLLAAAPLLDDRPSGNALAASSLLLGLGVLVRLQFAPFAAVLFLWALWRDPRRWPPLVLGGAAALMLGAASDLLRGAVPYGWVFVNFGKNIGEGVAARFGTSGPFQYLVELYLHFGAAALFFVALCATMAGRRYLPLLVAALAIVAAHSLIGHKEYRFIWVATLTLLVLAGIGSLNLARLVIGRRSASAAEGCKPLALTLGVWALLSLSSFHITGGFAAYRGGGNLTRLAIDAARRPEVCRIAVVDEYYSHVLPVVLPRAVPLSVAPKGVNDGIRPLPPAIARAANALLAQRLPRGAEAYRQAACTSLPRERPCLFIRPGPCAPDPDHDFQTALERGGM